jgi:hypothetical protein
VKHEGEYKVLLIAKRDIGKGNVSDPERIDLQLLYSPGSRTFLGMKIWIHEQGYLGKNFKNKFQL